MVESTPHIRPYDSDRDLEPVSRIMVEVGWQKATEREARLSARRQFYEAATGFVAELDGSPECYVSTMRGTYQYRGTPVPFTGVTGVATSRVARKQGLASRTTARALAQQAHEGAVVAGLGIFDQGFYNKLGFGTSAYDHLATIDPASLTVPYCRRTPVRLSASDAAEMHASRLSRRAGHGAVSLSAEENTRLRASGSESDFGLGFRDEATGELTHHLWVSAQNINAGPYHVSWMAYRTIGQFIELLGLLRNLGDQVYTVWLAEPSGIQLQDYIDRPFRRHRQGRRGEHETSTNAAAQFQYRIMDVPSAMEAAAEWFRRRGTTLPAFTMKVVDPVSRYLSDGDGWMGCGGVYRVEPDGARIAEAGASVDLEIGVGDLTRLWLGVLPATTLRDTGTATIDERLAEVLDDAFAGPPPRTDWFY
jgi:GNAT superfamily N-acetyltransferase